MTTNEKYTKSVRNIETINHNFSFKISRLQILFFGIIIILYASITHAFIRHFQRHKYTFVDSSIYRISILFNDHYIQV